MKLAMPRLRPTGTDGGANAECYDTAPLTVVGEPGTILNWPAGRSGGRDSVTVTAEVRAKRFADGRVEEERYTATAHAADRSPRALLAALAEGFAALDADPGNDERVIVEVRVVA